ncbi:MAG: hypothetical protein ACM34M_12050 [Ignavibacteria bacterium]
MTKRFALIIIISIYMIILSGCGDDPASIGTDILKDDLINIIEKDSFADSLTQSSSYYKRVLPLGESSTLLIGKNSNVESSILIKFFLSMPDSLETDLLNGNINVLSAKVLLTQVYSFGDSTASFDFSVHSTTSNWSQSSFTSDSLSFLNYDPLDVSSNRHYLNDDSLEFDLDNQLVLNWLKAQADTNIPADNGIYLKPSENAQKITGFLDPPLLTINIEKSGVYDTTLRFITYAEVSAVVGSVPSANSENIVIQNSVEFESKLWFDLSSLPKVAKINYAEVTLILDTTETITGSVYTKYVRANLLTDSASNSIDSNLTSAPIAVSGAVYKGEITHFVQNWVNGRDNQGMLITSAFLGEGVELLSFKGSNSADLAVRPRLKIIYTTKK